MRTLLILLAASGAALNAASGDTALDRYVRKPDASYRWDVAATLPCSGGCTATLIDMRSQTWRKPEEIDRTQWKHWVTVVVPAKVTSSTALLFITGGANDGKPRTGVDPMITLLAAESGAVVAEVRMIPNQPLVMAGETRRRSEDSFIAYTWDKFLRGGDEEWPARLPMTKAAVRAMDTVTDFCKSDKGGNVKVDRFAVSGGSKRGWTTWTTAAVDKRVAGIAPLVIDLLNLQKSFIHHWRVYGFWAPAVGDYTETKIMDWMGTKEYARLLDIVEPYSYRTRLTMPKYLVNSAGDQFFIPDSSQFYWKDLKGEKLLRYIPNTDHSMRNSDAVQSLLAWFQSLIGNKPRPRYDWKVAKDGTITVNAVDKPTEVKLWQATNPEARDFRLEKIKAAYKSSPLTADAKGRYVARVDKPAKGYTAYFVELTFPGPGKHPLKVTTQVKVVPDVYPHAAPLAKKPQ
ncbi:MAG: PhoPQ-activated pathogenicity [Acidobacteria bacterium]|nr:PhoPQ-activated pathogenicity [Acidobacteriota bacterium]